MAATRPLKSFMAAPRGLRSATGSSGLDSGVRRPGELHDGVVDVAHLQRPVVAQIALVHLPGMLRPLLGQEVGRALDVPRGQPEQGADAAAAPSLLRATHSVRPRSCMWFSRRHT